MSDRNGATRFVVDFGVDLFKFLFAKATGIVLPLFIDVHGGRKQFQSTISDRSYSTTGFFCTSPPIKIASLRFNLNCSTRSHDALPLTGEKNGWTNASRSQGRAKVHARDFMAASATSSPSNASKKVRNHFNARSTLPRRNQPPALRTSIRLMPASRHKNHNPFVFTDLATCEYNFHCIDDIKKSLEQRYTIPHRVK